MINTSYFHSFPRLAAMATWCVASLLVGTSAVHAQSGMYHEPLNEKLPPGFTADTLARIRRYDMTWLQPVRVELPSSGQVSVYSGTVDPLATIDAPAQFSVNAGHIYRLRVSGMPEFPDAEVYPSIEILDHLHPPVGQAANYPIPIVFSAADLKEALDGRMVTRVIYLEDPQFASQLDRLRDEVPQTVAPTDNALQEAGKLGRPLVIIRIGGRVPTGYDMPASFFGSGGAFDPGSSIPTGSGVARSSDRTPASRQLANQSAGRLRTGSQSIR
ncbi:MAG: hypothetical protein ACK58L_06585 [Planctomycetota bacterium]